jgi:Soluble NSF attachment protein, SNAP
MGVRVCSSRMANKHYLKVADLAALDGDYYKAIEQYEKIGKSSINNNLMKWSIKDYFLKAGICHLATNVRESCHKPACGLYLDPLGFSLTKGL